MILLWCWVWWFTFVHLVIECCLNRTRIWLQQRLGRGPSLAMLCIWVYRGPKCPLMPYWQLRERERERGGRGRKDGRKERGERDGGSEGVMDKDNKKETHGILVSFALSHSLQWSPLIPEYCLYHGWPSSNKGWVYPLGNSSSFMGTTSLLTDLEIMISQVTSRPRLTSYACILYPNNFTHSLLNLSADVCTPKDKAKNAGAFCPGGTLQDW